MRVGAILGLLGAFGAFDYNPFEPPIVYIRRPDTRYWRKRMEYHRRKANRFDRGDLHGHG